MGCDDLYKKRKAQSLKDKQRKIEKRKPYERVLIVCEGKTEKLYFKLLIEEYKLNTANVEIINSSGSDPKGIVNYAKTRYIEAKKEGNPFDRVYCVFDKDSHLSYLEAINTLAKLSPQHTFFAATSVPCFEYWFILHFDYTDKPYHATPQCSVADKLISDLRRKYLGNYKKNDMASLFRQLKHNMLKAIENAKKANKAAAENLTDNPSTQVGKLVEYLINLKK